MMAWHGRSWGRWRPRPGVAIPLLAATLAGCPAPADDNATEGAGATEGDDTTGSTMPTTMSPDATTGGPATTSGTTTSMDAGSDSGTTSGTGDGSTTDDTTSGSTGGSTTAMTEATEGTDSTDGTDGSSGTDGGAGEQDCASQCAVVFMCTKGVWETEQDCTDACVANLDKAGGFSPFCEQAWQALAVCLGGLTCEEYDQWQAPMAIPYPCLDEDDALAFECEGQ